MSKRTSSDAMMDEGGESPSQRQVTDKDEFEREVADVRIKSPFRLTPHPREMAVRNYELFKFYFLPAFLLVWESYVMKDAVYYTPEMGEVQARKTYIQLYGWREDPILAVRKKNLLVALTNHIQGLRTPTKFEFNQARATAERVLHMIDDPRNIDFVALNALITAQKNTDIAVDDLGLPPGSTVASTAFAWVEAESLGDAFEEDALEYKRTNQPKHAGERAAAIAALAYMDEDDIPDDGVLCVLCQMRPRTHASVECCHYVTCGECTKRLYEERVNTCAPKCPICKTISHYTNAQEGGVDPKEGFDIELRVRDMPPIALPEGDVLVRSYRAICLEFAARSVLSIEQADGSVRTTQLDDFGIDDPILPIAAMVAAIDTPFGFDPANPSELADRIDSINRAFSESFNPSTNSYDLEGFLNDVRTVDQYLFRRNIIHPVDRVLIMHTIEREAMDGLQHYYLRPFSTADRIDWKLINEYIPLVMDPHVPNYTVNKQSYVNLLESQEWPQVRSPLASSPFRLSVDLIARSLALLKLAPGDVWTPELIASSFFTTDHIRVAEKFLELKPDVTVDDIAKHVRLYGLADPTAESLANPDSELQKLSTTRKTRIQSLMQTHGDSPHRIVAELIGPVSHENVDMLLGLFDGKSEEFYEHVLATPIHSEHMTPSQYLSWLMNASGDRQRSLLMRNAQLFRFLAMRPGQSLNIEWCILALLYHFSSLPGNANQPCVYALKPVDTFNGVFGWAYARRERLKNILDAVELDDLYQFWHYFPNAANVQPSEDDYDRFNEDKLDSPTREAIEDGKPYIELANTVNACNYALAVEVLLEETTEMNIDIVRNHLFRLLVKMRLRYHLLSWTRWQCEDQLEPDEFSGNYVMLYRALSTAFPALNIDNLAGICAFRLYTYDGAATIDTTQIASVNPILSPARTLDSNNPFGPEYFELLCTMVNPQPATPIARVNLSFVWKLVIKYPDSQHVNNDIEQYAAICKQHKDAIWARLIQGEEWWDWIGKWKLARIGNQTAALANITVHARRLEFTGFGPYTMCVIAARLSFVGEVVTQLVDAKVGCDRIRAEPSLARNAFRIADAFGNENDAIAFVDTLPRDRRTEEDVRHALAAAGKPFRQTILDIQPLTDADRTLLARFSNSSYAMGRYVAHRGLVLPVELDAYIPIPRIDSRTTRIQDAFPTNEMQLRFMLALQKTEFGFDTPVVVVRDLTLQFEVRAALGKTTTLERQIDALGYMTTPTTAKQRANVLALYWNHMYEPWTNVVVGDDQNRILLSEMALDLPIAQATTKLTALYYAKPMLLSATYTKPVLRALYDDSAKINKTYNMHFLDLQNAFSEGNGLRFISALLVCPPLLHDSNVLWRCLYIPEYVKHRIEALSTHGRMHIWWLYPFRDELIAEDITQEQMMKITLCVLSHACKTLIEQNQHAIVSYYQIMYSGSTDKIVVPRDQSYSAVTAVCSLAGLVNEPIDENRVLTMNDLRVIWEARLAGKPHEMLFREVFRAQLDQSDAVSAGIEARTSMTKRQLYDLVQGKPSRIFAPFEDEMDQFPGNQEALVIPEPGPEPFSIRENLDAVKAWATMDGIIDEQDMMIATTGGVVDEEKAMTACACLAWNKKSVLEVPFDAADAQTRLDHDAISNQDRLRDGAARILLMNPGATLAENMRLVSIIPGTNDDGFVDRFVVATTPADAKTVLEINQYRVRTYGRLFYPAPFSVDLVLNSGLSDLELMGESTIHQRFRVTHVNILGPKSDRWQEYNLSAAIAFNKLNPQLQEMRALDGADVQRRSTVIEWSIALFFLNTKPLIANMPVPFAQFKLEPEMNTVQTMITVLSRVRMQNDRSFSNMQLLRMIIDMKPEQMMQGMTDETRPAVLARIDAFIAGYMVD